MNYIHRKTALGEAAKTSMTTACLPVDFDSPPPKTIGASPAETNPRSSSRKLHTLCTKASRLALALCVAGAVAALCTPRAIASGEAESAHPVHLFPSASDARGRQGFVRVINHSARAGEVSIRAFDEGGVARAPLNLTLGADETVHFNSGDLERGNPRKGLSGRTGAGEGNWRLELSSGLDIEVLSYIRTPDGFLTAIHDAAPVEGSRHRVAIFNPGSNRNQISLLRLVNPGGAAAEVSIAGVDDAGASPGAGARATVPARGSRTYTAAELESGVAAGLSGSIGDGSGKWRLTVRADRPILVMSLLSSPTGHLTNLSTAPGRGAGPPDVVPPGDSAPPPPLAPDPADLARRAEGFRSVEFARNPSLYYMNAHWAYARGLDGSGETTGMVDTGLYAAHQEFAGRLHDETVYTVVHDVSSNALDNAHYSKYLKVGEKDPATAYPDVSPDPNVNCQGVYCRFYQYNHGTLTASLAVGARNDAGAHGTAFGAKLFFRPFKQYAFNPTIGVLRYHPPGDIVSRDRVSYHQIARQVGDLALIVSNSWLTGDSTFRAEPAVRNAWPFYEVLTPRYVRYQRDRPATDQALMLWSAGNRPLSAGPFVDGAAVPSVSERQLRALSGGERGLADLLLTDEERAAISAAEALRRAERALEALKRRWLAVVAVADAEDTPARWREHVDCALSASAGDGHCAVDWIIGSSRCGYASDWCVAAGPTWGGVNTDFVEQPRPTGLYSLEPYRTSEAAAAASGALAVLLHAYRDEDGRLTVPTSTVLARLGDTARRDLFDPGARRGPDSRNELLREEDMIRALIRYAGASDRDLRELIATARAELNGSGPAGDSGRDRLWILNRLVDYRTTIDTDALRNLLNAAAGDQTRANDLLAQLIRQIEWIDEQLRRRGRTKNTATAADVREIAITSLIGHGLIDLKAATDPR